MPPYQILEIVVEAVVWIIIGMTAGFLGALFMSR